MNIRIPELIEKNVQGSWCPGCGHGIIVRLLAEAAEALGVEKRLVTVEDVACGEFSQLTLHCDSIMTAHGRTIVTAAGVKRALPNAVVVAHPGDGSAYSIGIESTIHCAYRNENILALVVNNSNFGMTGGQMSPTTVPGMKTSSCIFGRDEEKNGRTLDIMKLLGDADAAYLARGSVDSPAEIAKTGRMIRKALEKQLRGEGFCLVEVLSPCPTNWHMTPAASMEWIRNIQKEHYPVGEFADKKPENGTVGKEVG